MKPRPRSPCARRGFTLAEVAVTIVIIGIGLLLVLQSLNTAKLTAAHTRNMKVARELGMLTLGQIASGQFQEDIESGFLDSYAEEGYPDFTFEVALGDDVFREDTNKNKDGAFDNWDPSLKQDTTDTTDDEEQQEQPYEKVRVRVTYPAIKDLPHQLVLEQWVPWKQVYGEDETKKEEQQAASDAAAKDKNNG
jgi:prepilin-type N-terminal cleavage/methylation domain-containing protein